jgi:hypothetical protein
MAWTPEGPRIVARNGPADKARKSAADLRPGFHILWRHTSGRVGPVFGPAGAGTSISKELTMLANQTPVSARILLSTLIAAAGLSTGIARAQDTDGPGNDYCVIHNFRLTTPGNIAPIVRMIYDCHVRARTNRCNDLVGGPKDNRGIDAAAPFIQSANSTAPDSTGTANSIATITGLGPGLVTGSFEASGSGTPALTGCPPPTPPRGFGRVKAWSSTKVQAHGRKMDKRGRITMRGNWKSTETISGSLYKTIGRDPIKARLIDLTTGITTEHVLLSMKWAIGGASGAFEWDGASLSNTAPDLDFSITMNSAVTVQQGTLKVQVRGGVVTQSTATGEFAAVGLPPVGAGGFFSLPLPEIVMDYDLGGDENHDLETEFDFDNAGEVEKIVTGDGQEVIGGCITTDLCTGHDGANVSEVFLPDTTMGFRCSAPFSRLAVPLTPQPIPIELTALSLTSFGAIPAAAHARIWQGPPGVGVLVAGDLTTNRLMDVEGADTYRVSAQNPSDPSRPLSDVYIDLTWVPVLPPGQYWIEFDTQSQTISAQTFAIQSPWDGTEQPSLQFDTQLGQWRPTIDEGSGRPVTLATNVYFARSNPPQPCYANCDGSQGTPMITPNDFACFLNRYASGDPYANCDGSVGHPVLTPNDFLCFLNRAAQGCN